MPISFDVDLAGSVLEFAALFQNEHFGSRSAWEAANIKPSRGAGRSVNSPLQPWLGPAITRGQLESLLEIGRNKEDVRRRLERGFRRLEAEHLLEPLSADDNKNTAYRTITPLGLELLRTDAHIEYLGGPLTIVERWRQSVGILFREGQEGAGTAFLVDATTMVTACHVVEHFGPEGLTAEFEDGVKATVKSVRVPKDRSFDVAVVTLAAPVTGRRFFKLSDHADLLEPVIVFGFPPIPFTTTPSIVATRGEVSARPTLQFPQVDVVVVSCLLRGGFSGGPVVNARGQVIGVVSRNLFKKIREDEQLNEGLGFAAAFPATWARDAVHESIPTEILRSATTQERPMSGPKTEMEFLAFLKKANISFFMAEKWPPVRGSVNGKILLVKDKEILWQADSALHKNPTDALIEVVLNRGDMTLKAHLGGHWDDFANALASIQQNG